MLLKSISQSINQSDCTALLEVAFRLVSFLCHPKLLYTMSKKICLSHETKNVKNLFSVYIQTHMLKSANGVV